VKLLIIEPDSRAKLKNINRLVSRTFPIFPTLYSWQMASVTPKEHTVRVLSEMYEKIQYNEKYDLIDINFLTPYADYVYKIADNLRKKGNTISLSGFHASALPEEAKQHADSVIIGRGEDIWPELLKDLQENNLKPFYKPQKFLDPKIIPSTKIILPKDIILIRGIEATRGCPNQCLFCQESNIKGGAIFRNRPVENVIKEIKSIPQKALIFYDASLTINPEYTKSLFNEMKGLNKKFSCCGNIDVLANDEELLKLAFQAGCTSWLIGFESISQKTIDCIGKKSNRVKEYGPTIKKIHDYGMSVVGSFIFGFDTDTPDVFEKTMNAINDWEIDLADFGILTPYPGTPLFNRLEEEDRIITRDWSKYTMHHVVFKPKNMSEQKLLEGVRSISKEFYSNFNTINRTVKGLKLGFYPFLQIFIRNIIAKSY
jgi:radical SAM superfamily enzyme YgiQ (UPF0313 family)